MGLTRISKEFLLKITTVTNSCSKFRDSLLNRLKRRRSQSVHLAIRHMSLEEITSKNRCLSRDLTVKVSYLE